MPVHDWTRVVAGNFHDFHQTWAIAIKRRLNAGWLPPDYYALAELVAEGPIPDVLTLNRTPQDDAATGISAHRGGGADVALAEAPPKVRFVDESADEGRYARRADRVAVRHANGHEVVAFIEIISPGNKHTVAAVERFVEKVAEAVSQGIHVLVIDILYPGRHDPRGMHAAYWEWRQGSSHGVTDEEPFGFASYRADVPPQAFFERVALRSVLPEMPLFLTSRRYVNLSLEATYQDAWADVPEYWRSVLEAPP